MQLTITTLAWLVAFLSDILNLFSLLRNFFPNAKPKPRLSHWRKREMRISKDEMVITDEVRIDHN